MKKLLSLPGGLQELEKTIPRLCSQSGCTNLLLDLPNRVRARVLGRLAPEVPEIADFIFGGAHYTFGLAETITVIHEETTAEEWKKLQSTVLTPNFSNIIREDYFYFFRLLISHPQIQPLLFPAVMKNFRESERADTRPLLIASYMSQQLSKENLQQILSAALQRGEASDPEFFAMILIYEEFTKHVGVEKARQAFTGYKASETLGALHAISQSLKDSGSHLRLDLKGFLLALYDWNDRKEAAPRARTTVYNGLLAALGPSKTKSLIQNNIGLRRALDEGV